MPILPENRQKGFGVFTYILTIIVFVGAITSILTRGSNSNMGAQNNEIIAAKIFSQARKIQSTIRDCYSEASKARAGVDAVGPSEYLIFPACSSKPGAGALPQTEYNDSGYCEYSANFLYARVENLTCLAPSGPAIWDKAQGNFMPDPNPIQGFQPWQYSIEKDNTNPAAGGKGVSIILRTNSVNSDSNMD